jgi:4-amino-4-deoxy-L-arabinose transferase-like glycosyltransferase
MNAFEPLIWIGAAYLFVLAAEKNQPALWAALGVVSGLGLLNKYSMFFYLGACIFAIALTPARRALSRPGFWLAIAIALTLVAPSLAWQAQHGWPQIAVLRNAGADKNVTVSPFVFYAQQILMMNPLAAPIWLAGLYSLFFTRAGAPLRWYAFAYVILSATYLTLGAKVYYLAPIYPVLFAAGAAWLESRLLRVRPLAAAYPVLLLAVGLAIAPEAFPLLPLPQFLTYQHVFDLRGIKMERHPEGLVPQQFAYQLGWDSLVRTIATVYDALPAGRQRDAAILTRDYGQAAAVDFLGPKYGLPHAISGHNNYYLYGTRGASGRVVISVGIPKATLATEFRDVRLAATYRDPYLLPDFNNLPVYVSTDPIESFAAWWPATKHYI